MRRALLCLLLAACASEHKQPAAAEPEAPPPPPPPPDASVPTAEPAAPPPGRALTEGEIALVRPFFGDAIDYAKVRVIPERYFLLQPADVYMTPNGSIYAPGTLFEADFAAASVDPALRAVFVHEMTHVWQYQSGVNLIVGGVVEFLRRGGRYDQAYPYHLAAGLDLLDYGIEQQASIVEDQVRIHAGLSTRQLAADGLSERERDKRYAAILRRLYADPGYAHSLPPADLQARIGRATRTDRDN
ncbi:MAG TPA: hypothetical protein VL172_21795 [Kofleriaceae bacterium]|jgi:hypothetical protein|nr:hypothetical protein [Kofleriaceae bacterium]